MKDYFKITTKICQLKETLEIRHCPLVLGESGSDNSSVRKTLFYNNMKLLDEKLSP